MAIRDCANHWGARSDLLFRFVAKIKRQSLDAIAPSRVPTLGFRTMAFRALHEVLQHEAAWTLGPHCQPAEVAMLALSCSELLCHLSVFAERFAIFEMGRCSICKGRLSAPCRLRDCGHTACGRCVFQSVCLPAWTPWRCNRFVPRHGFCGQLCRKQPELLPPGDCAAAEAARAERGQGVDFSDRGWPADFDDLPSVSLAGLAETLQPGRSYILRHCPASLNFLGFSEERLDRESALDVVSRFVSLQI